MGAIIAALYSAGYSPETIKEIVRAQNWTSFINDIQERKYIAYEEKLFGDKYIFTIPIEGKVFSLSKSLNSSFNIDLMLNNLFAPVAHLTDFNDLPIPFLCIGTDLLTGEAVVLNEGNLARAVRASMAIPGYFSPTLFNGKYLVDGGVVNNYPAEQIKAMGADIIIGGDVQSGLKKDISEMESLTSILDQVISFNRVEANEKGVALTDYMVKFEMSYGMLDFAMYDSIINLGEKVARQHYNELKALADSINGIQPFEKKHVSIQRQDSLNLGKINWIYLELKHKDRYYNYFDDLEGRRSAIADLEEMMYQLNGTKIFNELRYEFEPQEKGPLNVRIEAENTNKGSMAAGIHYDNIYNGSILLNLTLRNIKGGRSKFFTDLYLGQNPRVKTMFIINNGFKPGFGLEADIYSFKFPFYEYGEKINQWDFDNYSFSAFMPLAISNNYFFRLGFQYERFRFKQEVVVDPELEDYNKFANYGNLFFSFNHDSRDKVRFTRKGQLVEIKAKYILPFNNEWDDVFTNGLVAYMKFNWNASLSNRFVFKPGLFLGYTLTQNSPIEEPGQTLAERKFPAVQHLFGFGGLNPNNYLENHISFTGLKFMDGMGIYAGKFSANLQYNFYPKLYATLMSDFGIIENELDNLDDIQFIVGYGIKLSYDSFVGPVEFSISGSNVDKSATGFLSIGYWF
jgi:NTE family protein